MVQYKIKNSLTATGILGLMVISMAIFFAMFNYASFHYDSAGVTVPTNYSDSYDELGYARDNLTTNIDGIKNAAINISEADLKLATVAWNGLTGLAYTLRLFINLIGISVLIWDALFPALIFLPVWVKILGEVAIIGTVVFVVIGLLKGEQKT